MPDTKKAPATADLEMEVFAEGTWNGVAYTKKDLDDMVKAFTALKGKVDPPLKLGHADQQKFWPQKDGAPALGWVKELKHVGQKLVAVFTSVPKVIADLIQKGAYRKRSAEIYHDFKAPDKKTYSRVLKAVALLGTDMPAVQTLDDIVALYAQEHGEGEAAAEGSPTVVEFEESLNAKQSRIRTAFRETFRKPKPLPYANEDGPWVDEVFQTYVVAEYKGKWYKVAYTDDGTTVTFGDITEVERTWQPVMNGAKAFSIAPTPGGEAPASCAGSAEKPAGQQSTTHSLPEGGVTLPEDKVKEYQDKIAALETENAGLKAKSTEVEAEKARLFAEKRKGEIAGLVSTGKTEGRVLPRFEKQLTALLESCSDSVEVQFAAADGKTEKVTQFEMAKRFVAALPKILTFGEVSEGSGNKPEKGDIPDPETQKKEYSELLAQKAKEYSEQHKVSIRDATIAVDRELRKEAKG
jgi:hypothetical protein